LEDSDAEPSLEVAADQTTAAFTTNSEGVEITEGDRGTDKQPPKKKRKRGPRKKASGKATAGAADEGEGGERGEADSKEAGNKPSGPSNKKGKKGKGKSTTLQERKEASEKRRRRRIAERNINTTCFACREKGHAIQDCPKIADGSIKPPENQSGFSTTGVIGICYRCGSRKHRLSACREKVSDPSNPLPFASCFVCNGSGHLASQCPKNKEKGVYPNGGSCKLCGETDHLARNCKLRGKAATEKTMFFGTGAGAGADEDDFHAFKRTSAEVDKEQKAAERILKSKLKPPPQSQKKKNVVNF